MATPRNDGAFGSHQNRDEIGRAMTTMVATSLPAESLRETPSR